MAKKTIILNNLEALGQFCTAIKDRLFPGMVLLLEGPIGAGKTSFVRILLRMKGITGKIQSPTYTLINTYPSDPVIHHMDLYRLSSTNDIAQLDIESYFEDTTSILIIEWADKLDTFYPDAFLSCRFDYLSEEGRELTLSYEGEQYAEFLDITL